MLKYSGQWEALSDRERLVLLAIAVKLPQTIGLEMKDCDILDITGLSETDFQRTISNLVAKDLVYVDSPGNTFCSWIAFKGDALTLSLMGEKKPLRTDPH